MAATPSLSTVFYEDHCPPYKTVLFIIFIFIFISCSLPWSAKLKLSALKNFWLKKISKVLNALEHKKRTTRALTTQVKDFKKMFNRFIFLLNLPILFLGLINYGLKFSFVITWEAGKWYNWNIWAEHSCIFYNNRALVYL